MATSAIMSAKAVPGMKDFPAYASNLFTTTIPDHGIVLGPLASDERSIVRQFQVDFQFISVDFSWFQRIGIGSNQGLGCVVLR